MVLSSSSATTLCDRPRELCRTADELDALTAAMAGASPVVEGSQGQPRPNPLLAEIRQHRKLAETLALSLALPVDG